MSRRAYDLSREQVGFYREQAEAAVARADRYMEALIRLKRLEAGVSEIPRTERVKMDRPPKEFEEYVSGFANEHMRRLLREKGIDRVKAGETWESVMADIRSEEDAA